MRLLALGLLIFAVGIIGCGPDVRSDCEKQVQCYGGNDKDIEACVAITDVVRDFADEIDCSSEYDDYLTCVAPLKQCSTEPTGQMCTVTADCLSDSSCSNGECVQSSYRVTADAQDKCKAESAAYNACFKF